MEINGNFQKLGAKLSIDTIEEAAAAINSQREMHLSLPGAGRVKIGKLTRGQFREIVLRLGDDQLQALAQSFAGVDLTQPGALQEVLVNAVQYGDETLDRILDYGTDFPGGTIKEGAQAGTPVRDSIALDEQLLAAAAVLVLNITGNRAVRVFSEGVSDAAQPESEPMTAATSPAPTGSAAA